MGGMPHISKDNYFSFLTSIEHDTKIVSLERFYSALADHNLELVAIIDHELLTLETETEKEAFLKGVMLIYSLIHRAHVANELEEL